MTHAVPPSLRSQLREVDDATFDAEVASAPLVLVKFTAAWCPPCRALQPTLEAVAKDRPGLQVLSVDVDEQQATAQRFGVRALPTLLVFRGGQVAGQVVGNQSRAAVERLLGG
ncbi:MAG: thioredoxin family protein [Myxococcaceae bacterium]|nr:thioredoxin family protein [Myxococcaceae bacterium]